MALSSFFSWLSIRAESRTHLCLNRLMLIHGIFFISCFFMPMTGMFTGMADSKGNGGSLALLFWCAYFFPIGALAWKHFNSEKI